MPEKGTGDNVKHRVLMYEVGENWQVDFVSKDDVKVEGLRAISMDTDSASGGRPNHVPLVARVRLFNRLRSYGNSVVPIK